MSTENIVTLGFPYQNVDQSITEKRIACTSFSDGIFAQNAAQACMGLMTLAYMIQVWEKLLVDRPVTIQGPYLVQETFQLLRPDRVGPNDYNPSPPQPLLYIDLACIDIPEGAAEYFPATGIYRIGHYSFTYENEYGNLFQGDLKLIRNLNQRIIPPNDGAIGAFLHLYPGFTLEVEMGFMSRSSLAGLHVKTTSMDFNINPNNAQPQPYLTAP